MLLSQSRLLSRRNGDKIMDGNIFPLPFSAHLIFAVVAFVFFLIQFIRVRYKYQLVMAVAVAMTMLIYLKDTKLWFYGIGILEFGLLIIALVAAISEKKRRRELEAEISSENATEDKKDI